MDLDNSLLGRQEVETGRFSGAITETRMGQLTTEGSLQEVEPFDRSVDVGEALVVVAFEQVEDAAGYEEALELL